MFAPMPRPTNALIVDDEPHVRAFLRLVLKELGITTCWEAPDGAQALEMVVRHKPELVLLDVNLPVMGGLEMLAKLQVIAPEIPVIMMSSESALKTVREAARLGAWAYVLKHNPKADILKALREAIDSLADAGSKTGAEDEQTGESEPDRA